MKKLNLSALANNNLMSEENIIKIDDNNISNENLEENVAEKRQEPIMENKTLNKKLTLKDLNINVKSPKNDSLTSSKNTQKPQLNTNSIVDKKLDNELISEKKEDNIILAVQPKFKISLSNEEKNNFTLKSKEESIIEENSKEKNIILTNKQELKIQDSETNLNLQIENNNEIFSNYVPSTKKEENLHVNQTEKKLVKIQEEKEVETKINEKVEIKKTQTKKQDFNNLIIKLNSLSLKIVLNLTKFKFYVKNLFKINIKTLKIIEKVKNKKIYIPLTVGFLGVFGLAIFMFQQNNFQTYQIKSNVQEIQKISTGMINQELNDDNVNINKINTIDNNIKSHKIKKELKEFLLKNQK